MIGGGGIHSLQIVFLVLLLFVVVFAALARRLQGPWLAVVSTEAEAQALLEDLEQFATPVFASRRCCTRPRIPPGATSDNLVSILFLAIGLVGFTVIGIAEAAR
jgi:hypothetical protein